MKKALKRVLAIIAAMMMLCAMVLPALAEEIADEQTAVITTSDSEQAGSEEPEGEKPEADVIGEQTPEEETAENESENPTEGLNKVLVYAANEENVEGFEEPGEDKNEDSEGDSEGNSEVDPEENAEEEEMEPVVFTGSVVAHVVNPGPIYYGDMVVLRVFVIDANLPYEIKWEVNRGGGWSYVSGGRDFVYYASEENKGYRFRVALDTEAGYIISNTVKPTIRGWLNPDDHEKPGEDSVLTEKPEDEPKQQKKKTSETVEKEVQTYAFERSNNGALLLDACGDPIVSVPADCAVPVKYLRDADGNLVFDENGEPIVIETVEAGSVLLYQEMDIENPDHYVKVYGVWDDTLNVGDEVTLKAILYGYEEETYTVVWQTSEDGENWTDVIGEGDTLVVTVAESNRNNYWRAQVIVIDAEQAGE